MSCCLKIKLIMSVTLGLCLIVLGCGKKVATKGGDSAPEQTRPEQTALEAYLSKQQVVCEQNQACPNYIAKLVVVNGSQYRSCTGFLTDDDVIATSASCLPDLLRLSGQDCSRDVFFFFPRTASRPAERIGCHHVILSSSNSGQDPILWHHDVAFLRLSKAVKFRRSAQISREGILHRSKYTTWMIDQQDDSFAILKKTNCDGVHNSYINPLVSNESSPNMIMADCVTTRGATGAPILDGSRVRGMVSRAIDPSLREYLLNTGLLNNGLKEMIHATNFACAPTPNDTDSRDQAECTKRLEYSEVDRLRAEMLSTNMLFGNLRRKYEESLSNTSKYVNFGVKLIPKGNVQETEIYPKCFKPLANWLESLNNTRNTYVDNITLPSISFRKVMDPYGRVQGMTVHGEEKETFVQFSLKNLRSVQRSSILMWYKGEAVRTFPTITEECSASLF